MVLSMMNHLQYSVMDFTYTSDVSAYRYRHQGAGGCMYHSVDITHLCHPPKINLLPTPRSDCVMDTHACTTHTLARMYARTHAHTPASLVA